MLCIWFLIPTFNAHSIDIIKINDNPAPLDVRGIYINELMLRALDLSREQFGEYQVVVSEEKLPNLRMRKELLRGEFINIAVAVVSSKWEESTIPVYIPLRQGVLSYRLLLAHESIAEQLSKIETVEELKSFTVGLRRGWSTRGVLKAQGFSVVDTYSYEAIFQMLHKKRFDFTVRGAYEVYDEIRLRKHLFDDLVVVPNLAIKIPAATYFFVSPKTPRIADRLTFGLEKMVASGELRQRFAQTYGKDIAQANLQKRRLLELSNPMMSNKTPWYREELWLDIAQPEMTISKKGEP